MHDQEFIEKILKEGKRYIPAVLPRAIRRGKLGRCYDNSIVPALATGYRYVEGIAESPKMRGIWVLHAWLTDGVFAYDPTWEPGKHKEKEIPIATTYIGVEMQADAVARFMLRTEYAGIFANAWRDQDLARDAAGWVPAKPISSCFILEDDALIAPLKL